MKEIGAIILAAGQGTRMKSRLPKVAHEICGRPMISYVVDAVKALKITEMVVVVGFQGALVKNMLGKGIKTVEQKRLSGTADAVKSARGRVHKKHVLVICGDAPLVKKEALAALLRQHLVSAADVTVLTAFAANPAGYGRIIRDKYGALCRIGEEKDISDSQRAIKEINSGVYCFRKDILFKFIGKVRPDNAKKEYYLTDLIELLSESHGKVETVCIDDSAEILGINSRADLARANQVMRHRILDTFMREGVTIIDPQNTYVFPGVSIGQDTVIHPYTIIEDGVVIGRQCSVGPFCRLRSGTRIKDGAKVGNFVEIVRSTVGEGTLAKHFSYLGDVSIGKKANIGAGTVTANFDGKEKNKTTIGDAAFIGSDTVLIAPVKVGRGAVTGAGSVVTRNHNVSDNTIVAGVPARKLVRGKNNG